MMGFSSSTVVQYYKDFRVNIGESITPEEKLIGGEGIKVQIELKKLHHFLTYSSGENYISTIFGLNF